MLADISRVSHIYIVCGYTDMRKSIDGLCAVIQDQLQMNPSGSSLFLFCGRRCDRIKVLLKEPDGYVLIYKRLTAQYGRYRWPRNESEVRDLSWKEFDWLMSGLDIDQPKAIRNSRRCSAKGGGNTSCRCSKNVDFSTLFEDSFSCFWYNRCIRNRRENRCRRMP